MELKLAVRCSCPPVACCMMVKHLMPVMLIESHCILVYCTAFNLPCLISLLLSLHYWVQTRELKTQALTSTLFPFPISTFHYCCPASRNCTAKQALNLDSRVHVLRLCLTVLCSIFYFWLHNPGSKLLGTRPQFGFATEQDKEYRTLTGSHLPREWMSALQRQLSNAWAVTFYQFHSCPTVYTPFRRQNVPSWMATRSTWYLAVSTNIYMNK